MTLWILNKYKQPKSVSTASHIKLFSENYWFTWKNKFTNRPSKENWIFIIQAKKQIYKCNGSMVDKKMEKQIGLSDFCRDINKSFLFL